MKQQLLLLLLISAYSFWGSQGTSFSPIKHQQQILLLDVDNTLYRETVAGIERQIIENIHSFVGGDDDAQRADALHRTYGSTVRGLAATVWKDRTMEEQHQQQERFYASVYNKHSIDVSSLLQVQHKGSTAPNTGYTAKTTDTSHNELRETLMAISAASSPCSLGIASNSPLCHVERVLHGLGLARVPWTAGILTPGPHNHYRTKPDPAFFSSSISSSKDDTTIRTKTTLIDDSVVNVQSLQSVLHRTILVDDKNGVLNAIHRAMDWVDNDYVLDDERYLAAKNKVDFESIHAPTWHRMLDELVRCTNDTDNTLVVADVGAGLLSMMDLLLHGTDRLRPLRTGGRKVHYHAYESNPRLATACRDKLLRMGFQEQQKQKQDDTTTGATTTVFALHSSDDDDHDDDGITPTWLVYWHGTDYTTQTAAPSPVPHLIVGCCFADLFDPHCLVASLLGTFGTTTTTTRTTNKNNTHGPLVYFPITFAGITQALPPGAFAEDDGQAKTMMTIPSDTMAFAVYADQLRDRHGHNLEPRALIEAMADYGGTLLAEGASPWIIDPEEHPYLWETMLYFFGSTAASTLMAKRMDPKRWLDRLRFPPKTLRVSNVDLLFRLPTLGNWHSEEREPTRDERDTSKQYQEILFTAPGRVTTVEKTDEELAPNQIRIRSEFSLISSGTELKIFSGSFENSPLDLTIAGMKDETMAYPLAYGYSLVGRVVECGEDVDAASVLGKRVFVFAAHASRVVADIHSVQFVPDGISARDAVFLPSVETALSLVQDARPVFGEKVAVFGQGLIGLLVTAILGLQNSSNRFGSHGTLTTFDTVPDRLALSAKLGAHEALFPSSHDMHFQFDVAIEVSGNGQALQSAIDFTRDGGRIVVGSWYGDTVPLELRLGMDFHRSHKTIKASQVSQIPAELSHTWDKQRRFDLAWEVIRQLQPSQLITRQTSLDYAEEGYRALKRAREIAVIFGY